MLYDIFFKLLDSISTFHFLLFFFLIFISVQQLLFRILLTISTYKSLCYEKQSAILCHMMEVMVQMFITYIALVALWRQDIHILDTSNHKQNPQVMINIATMYAMKDVVELFVNKKIARTTIAHHLCVILAYFYVVRVLTTNFNVEGFFKCFIAYGAFTTLNFPYKIYLSLRFFIDRTGSMNNFCKTFAFFHKILCVSVNFSWQTFYFIKLITIFYFTGSSALSLLLSVFLYAVFMSAWAREEYVVMSYLRKEEKIYQKRS